jgi:hypothetical protein
MDALGESVKNAKAFTLAFLTYFTKPYSSNTLRSTLSRVLRNYGARGNFCD